VALAGPLGVTIDYLVSGAAAPPMLEHRAWLYEDDAEFLAAATPFLAEAVDRSERALAVIRPAHIAALQDELGPRASAVQFVEQTDWYSTPTGALRRYQAFLNSSLEAGAPWVRIIGEPIWAGRSASEARAWCRYEAMLNLAFAAEPATVVCPYDKRTVGDDVIRHAHATHPHTVERERVTPSDTYADPGAFVLDP
jgi:hypothetical protein